MSEPSATASSIIASVASAGLARLGLRRVGRSRSWVDDRAWWLGLVEFQPSGYSSGTYLNVGVQWLWSDLPHHAYMVGGRLREFQAFRSEDEFEAAVRALVDQASAQIHEYREMFGSVEAVARYFAGPAHAGNDVARAHDRMRRETAENLMHAATALGLAGRRAEAALWFDAYLSLDDDREFAVQRRHAARAIARRLRSSRGFEEAIRAVVVTTRRSLRLDEWTAELPGWPALTADVAEGVWPPEAEQAWTRIQADVWDERLPLSVSVIRGASPEVTGAVARLRATLKRLAADSGLRGFPDVSVWFEWDGSPVSRPNEPLISSTFSKEHGQLSAFVRIPAELHNGELETFLYQALTRVLVRAQTHMRRTHLSFDLSPVQDLLRRAQPS